MRVPPVVTDALNLLLAWWPHVAGFLLFTVDTIAVCHIILFKRDSRSAVGWIGIVLVFPLIGAIIYALLGINRIQRRASKLRVKTRLEASPLPDLVCPRSELAGRLPPDARHLETIARVSHKATGTPLLYGNSIEPLQDGDGAYPAMISAIRRAERSISLSTYIFDNDRAGAMFIEALGEAARRKVHIRVLVDYVGSRYSFPSSIARLRRAGVRSALFLKTFWPWRAPYMNLRSHRKIMVVDGRVAFTGGMNIREGCRLSLNPSDPVRDLHFMVRGPLVRQLQECFIEDWSFATGEVLDDETWFAPDETAGPTIARAIRDGPDEDYDRVRRVMLGALAGARRRVRIATPYFIPDSVLIGALNVCAMRDVAVEIVLPEKNNLRLVQWASTAQLWQVLKHGCRIWLTPPPFDHSKMMIVDDAWSLIGSSNWDARSLRLNFEHDVECYDADFARHLNRILDAKLASAREISLEDVDRRSIPVRLRDGVARLMSPYL